MRKFRFVHHYEIGIPLFEDIIFNPLPEDEENLGRLENLKSREELERFEDERCIRSRVRVFATASLPEAVRFFIRPEMLSWIEETVYDKNEHFWDWNIVPYYFREYVSCSGRMAIICDGDGRCRRVTEGSVDIGLPVFGDLAEKFVVETLRKNLDQEFQLFQESIRRRHWIDGGQF